MNATDIFLAGLFALVFGVPLLLLTTFALWRLFRRLWKAYRRWASARAQLDRRIAKTWELALRRLEGATIAGGGMSVRVDGMELRIEPVENPDGVRVVASGECGIPTDVTIRTRSEGSLAAEPADPGDVRTGDTEFDARIQLRGGAAPLIALLDRELRRHLLHHAEDDDIQVDAGRISWMSRGTALSSHDLLRRIDRVRDLAERIRQATSAVPSHLAKNVAKDPVGGARAVSLRILNETFPGTREAREATMKALGDADPAVRLAAASHAGPEGLVVLSRLATWGGKVVSKIRIQALRRVVESAPRPTAVRMIDDLLEHAAGRRLQAAVAECGRIRHRAALPKLIGLLQARNQVLAAEAARALGAFGERSLEPALIAALGPGRPVLAIAAAEALGRVGTVTAAEALRKLGADAGANDPLRAAAAAAVRAIEDRLDIDRGQLVISDATQSAGELSIVERPEGGEVSVMDAEPPSTLEAE